MVSEQVHIKVLNTVPANGQLPRLTAGAELFVAGATAAALILTGAAIKLPTDRAAANAM